MHRNSSLSFTIYTCILVALIIGSQSQELFNKGNKIYDSTGGMRIFHGVNVVEKVPPYYDTSFNETDMKKLREWGINGIRLGVMWPGVQPSEGFYNQTYIQYMVDLVETAGRDYGIYTLVEFHQDLFSEKFCADGVPMWAIPKSVYQSFPRPLTLKKGQFNNETGLPQSCGHFPWSDFYFTEAVNKAFGHLWKNKNGLLDKFANYWKKVASAFKNSKYVIAYELMNQPWPGNMYENPLVMVPGMSQKFHLQGAYDYLANQIRTVDTNHNICFQPVTWLNNFESGFTHPPGGHRFQNSSILCYHYYSPPTLNANKFFEARLKDVQKLNSAAILSQFYIINKQGQRNVPMMDLCDKHSHSWFGWIYNSGSGEYIIKQIRRTYAQRTAGTVISQQYNQETKQFVMSYYSSNRAGETSIFVDKVDNYPGGFWVDCYPIKCTYTVKDQGSNAFIIIDSSQFVGDGLMIGVGIGRL